MTPKETYYLYTRLGIVICFMLVVIMSLFYWPIHIADEHSPEWLVASFGRWILAIGGGIIVAWYIMDIDEKVLSLLADRRA